MVLSDLSPSDLPTLRGNPFDSRPIERNRASEIVGREDILIGGRNICTPSLLG